MTRSASVTYLGSEFNSFLFAPIGEDRRGMLLSVVSALARLDIDPWEEAAKLARLPVEAAAKRLTELISALPDKTSNEPDLGIISARLIALLPRQTRSDGGSQGKTAVVDAWANYRAVIRMIALNAMLVALALGVQGLVASRHPPAPGDNARAAATSTSIPQVEPPIAGLQ